MNKIRIYASIFVLAFLLTSCGGGIDFDRAHSSPENVVEEFIKAFQADRASALQLVPAEAQQTDRFKSKWKQWSTMTINKYEMRGVENGEWVTVQMEIQVGDHVQDFKDQFTVMEIDGKWWVVSIPT